MPGPRHRLTAARLPPAAVCHHGAGLTIIYIQADDQAIALQWEEAEQIYRDLKNILTTDGDDDSTDNDS